jgi:hypothetical protein
VSANLDTAPAFARQQLDAWTGGHPAGEDASGVQAPVLLVTSDDAFFTHPFLVSKVGSRFDPATLSSSSMRRVPDGRLIRKHAVDADALRPYVLLVPDLRVDRNYEVLAIDLDRVAAIKYDHSRIRLSDTRYGGSSKLQSSAKGHRQTSVHRR